MIRYHHRHPVIARCSYLLDTRQNTVSHVRCPQPGGYLLLLLPHNWSPVHASNWIVTNKCLMSNNWVFSTISVFVLVRWWRVTDYYLVRIFWFVFARLKLISVGTWSGWCNHILTPRPQPQSTHSSIQWLQLNTQLELQTFLWFSRSQRRPLLPVLSHLRHY